MKPLRAINVMFVMKMIVYCKVIVFIVPVAYCNDRIAGFHMTSLKLKLQNY